MIKKLSVIVSLVCLCLCTVLLPLQYFKVSADTEIVTINNLDAKTNRTTKSNSSAEITVFTPGLNSLASIWSNNIGDSNFSNEMLKYENDSLIEKIRSKDPENTVVYLATIDSLKGTKSEGNKTVAQSVSNFANDSSANPTFGAETLKARYLNEMGYIDLDQLYLIPQYTNNYCFEGINGDTANILTKYVNNGHPIKRSLTTEDVNKHIIILFQQYTSYISENNDYVYMQLEYILDNLSYDYYSLTNKLPTYNLISHSKGGLTNMQYALAHPYNVSSIYTLGAPFSGSLLGSAFTGTLELAGLRKNYAYKEDENGLSLNYCPGVLDILNKDLTDSYRNYWNRNYNSLFSHINFVTIGSYIDLGFIGSVLYEYAQMENIEWLGAVSSFVSLINLIEDNDYNVGMGFARGIVKHLAIVYFKTLNYMLPLDEYFIKQVEAMDNIKYTTLFGEHIGERTINGIYFADDLFIDLGSQVADGYSGVRKVYKQFKMGDFSNSKKSMYNVGVAHNLEAKNKDITDFISKDIKIGRSVATYDVVNYKTGVEIVSYNGGVTGDTITIPNTIDGKAVLKVGDNAFNGELWNKDFSNIKHIEVPANVEKIGKSAFANMTGLESVEFDKFGNLREIDSFAFSNTALVSLVLPGSLGEVGHCAFTGADKLEVIEIDNYRSSTYSSSAGVLFDKAGTTLIAVPNNFKKAQYKVPQGVEYIAPYAFYKCKNLQNINLNRVSSVYKSAFEDCTALETIDGNDLMSVGMEAFENTKFINLQRANNNDFIVVANAIVEYNGTKETLKTSDFPLNAMTIGEGAFAGASVRTVGLPKRIAYVDNYGFGGMENLNEIRIYKETNCLEYILLCTNEDTKIKVKNSNLNYFTRNENLNDYNIESIATNVTINLGVGTEAINYVAYYGDNYVLPINENSAIKLVDEENNVYARTGVWNKEDANLVLNAVTENKVVWICNNQTVYEQELQIGDVISFSDGNIIINGEVKISVIANYYEIVSSVSGDIVYDGSINQIILNAIPIEYQITVQNANPVTGNAVIFPFNITNISDYGLNYFQLYNEKYNYLGLYTAINGELIDTPAKLINIAKSSNKVAYAKWERIKYVVTVDVSNNEQTAVYEIESGERFNLTNPIYQKPYYSFVGWLINGALVNNSYVIVNSDIWIVAKWEPINYNINYHNVDGLQNPNVTTYNAESGNITLNENIVKSGFIFEGWFTDSGFTNRVTIINFATNGANCHIYAKWKMSLTFSRTTRYTITDSGRFNQSRDIVNIRALSGMTVAELISAGYTTLNIHIEMMVKEVDDGYQYIWLYDEPDEDDPDGWLYGKVFEHGSGYKDTDSYKHYFDAVIQLSDITNDNFYVLFGASGYQNDTWLNWNLTLNIESSIN